MTPRPSAATGTGQRAPTFLLPAASRPLRSDTDHGARDWWTPPSLIFPCVPSWSDRTEPRSDALPRQLRPRVGAPDLIKGPKMNVVKDICTVVPVVALTADTVLGAAVVISLSSLALL